MADRRAEENVVSGQPTQKTIADFDPAPKPKRNKYALACAMLASMTSILLGYDIGVMSGAAIFIKDDLHISDVQVEVLVGILNLYSLIGSAAAGRTSDWIGRRYTIVLAGAIFFAGSLLMGFATNYSFLMFGRFVAGIGVGYALMIAPVYTAEVSPASSRGFLTSFADRVNMLAHPRSQGVNLRIVHYDPFTCNCVISFSINLMGKLFCGPGIQCNIAIWWSRPIQLFEFGGDRG
ncbi:putative major facilitator, sugar transporter, major facilitator superfamily [Rosa chinensis]|uniref:Putative major facilitator, sugar transporter, major facilitator superfamily n=1 Tax=Rosa chinensis TaxID=74649 RepID=A0A2P6PNZ9_ROSCH|nr:putative major facilitator, sugar transporter, major facilitator superfamily [Rosa chinensis]